MKCGMIISPAGEGPSEQDIECENEAAIGTDSEHLMCVECAEEMAEVHLLCQAELEQLAAALEARAAKGGR